MEMIITHNHLNNLNILPNHTPLLTNLKPNPIQIIKQNNTKKIFYISNNFLKIQPNIMKILTNTTIRTDNLNKATTIEAHKAIEKTKKL